jgi:hypothetical protein
MIAGWLHEASEEFWRLAGDLLPYPRDLKPILSRKFPVFWVALPHLSVTAAERWLLRRGRNYHFLCRDRSLYGCIVVMRKRAIIFLDSLSSEEEQRFTLFHEVSHYLLDYRIPRRRVIERFGAGIADVLDGDRPPTPEERVDALLGRTPLGSYHNLLPRSERGGIDQGLTLRAEERADLLALELLAPAVEVEEHLCAKGVRSARDKREGAPSLLQSQFGLPPVVAEEYARRLYASAPLTARNWLGI